MVRDSEFPALGGQTTSNPAQAWSRINSQSPSHNRGLQQLSQQVQASQQQQQQQHMQSSQQQHDNQTFAKDIFSEMDDFRNAQQASQRQPQGPIEDFPALPRTQQESLAGLDQRSMGGLGQRQGMPSRLLPQLDGMIGQQAGPITPGEVDKKSILKLNGAPGLTNNLSASQGLISQQPSRPSPAPGLPHPSQLQTQQPLPKAVGANGDELGQIATSPHSLEAQRFDLAGLFNAMRGDIGEGSLLAKGQDLMNLGLDINSSEPLWPQFASPFAEQDGLSVEPEYHLPACYTVRGTMPVHSKIASFSDETLFYIFYTMPRDIMQEMVVSELAARNWRYHMVHRVWMTKDPTAQVEQFSETAEKGVYVFFDPNTWDRVKKEIVLEYSHLDPKTTGTYLSMNTGAMPLPGTL